MNVNSAVNGLAEKELAQKVDFLNKEAGFRQVKTGMDKDDFLKILITQLTHQDPTAPMQDREFIAQMAQFSSLEQMTNVSRSIETLANRLTGSGAAGMLGKTVEIAVGESTIEGKVEQVTLGDFPQVRVNGIYYSYTDLRSVKTEEEAL
jgi:flagellar basal-body rod modification protein FlgD